MLISRNGGGGGVHPKKPLCFKKKKKKKKKKQFHRCPSHHLNDNHLVLGGTEGDFLNRAGGTKFVGGKLFETGDNTAASGDGNELEEWWKLVRVMEYVGASVFTLFIKCPTLSHGKYNAPNAHLDFDTSDPADSREGRFEEEMVGLERQKSSR